MSSSTSRVPVSGLESRRKSPRKILIVEAVGFVAILVLSWWDEFFEWPKSLFAAYTARPELWEGVWETAMILAIAGAILLMTRRLLSRLFYLERLLRICAWCGKIQRQGTWTSLEEYLSSGFDTKMTHGMCPDCFEKAKERSAL
jgi:hypothetical protein